MFRLLFYATIFYLFYRYVLNPVKIAAPRNPNKQNFNNAANNNSQKNRSDDEGEYVDYEEIK